MDERGGDRSLVTGPGWLKLAEAIAHRVPPATIEAIYAFLPVRRAGREWGTAVVTASAQERRRRIFQARYWFQTRGRDRGRARVEVNEVGEGPDLAVEELLAGVQRRMGDVEPPIAVDPRWWYEG